MVAEISPPLRIPVALPQTPYEIVIQRGAIAQLGTYLQGLGLGKKILLVSNPEIFALYGAPAIASLEAVGFRVSHHLIPAGEQYKNLEAIADLYDTALQEKLERSSTMVALGGGVIGDMTGFAAATWLRGINFVQVPTTLLAMVDASVGGKTGVNHPQGKNLIGAFYQPKRVIIDPTVLASLPEREYRAGMAEVIKYGIIWDRDLFETLEQAEGLANYATTAPALLEQMLERSCQAKAAVVTQDEREGGIRAILNYGHTLGHAIESLTHYTALVHGEAVAIGMVLAGQLAIRMGLWTEEEAQRQDRLIQTVGLPTLVPPQLAAADIIDLLQTDKKVKDGRVRFVLPETIGRVIITDQVTRSLLEQVLGA